MGYVTLYRKYRPKNFDEILGQEHVTKTLQNAIKENKISHAYLFTGPRGTGKTTTARVLAKALSCQNGPTPNPCGLCNVCQNIANESVMDIIEIDAASNRGIDDIRELKEQLLYRPTQCRYKIYIIDEVHMLSGEAFNAFLKSLEEPPEHVIFILATTEPHKLLPTILSRCQRYNFKRITDKTIKDCILKVLKLENYTSDEQSINLLTKLADGSMRDALSLLEQVAMYSQGNINIKDSMYVLGEIEKIFIFDYMELLIKGDIKEAINLVDSVIESGKNYSSFLYSLIEYLKDTIIFKTNNHAQQLIFSSKEEENKFRNIADYLSLEEIEKIFDETIKCENQIKISQKIKLFLEVLTFKIISILNTRKEKIPIEDETTKSKDLKVEDKIWVENKKSLYKAEEERISELTSDNEEKWKKIKELIRKENIILHTFIYETKLICFDESTLIIEFPSDAIMQRETVLESAKYKEIISEHIKNIFGKPYKVKYKLADSQKMGKNIEQKVKDEENSPKPILPIIRNLFFEFNIKEIN